MSTQNLSCSGGESLKYLPITVILVQVLKIFLKSNYSIIGVQYNDELIFFLLDQVYIYYGKTHITHTFTTVTTLKCTNQWN